MSAPFRKEDRLLDKAARFAVNHEITDFVMPYLEIYSRTDIIGNLLFPVVAPWTILMGQEVFDFASIMSTNPKENASRLIDRIRQLEEQKRLNESKDNSVSKTKTRSRRFLRRR
ncbi:hypothetical protein MUP00_05020 [Candidatus Bathyarchaeota archaeon]|nr:hypothetical protein [Candidatus Bathyarchaeota archaeon]